MSTSVPSMSHRHGLRATADRLPGADLQRMRILVVSDLHYRLPHFDWLVAAAAQVDAVALVGDLAQVVSPVPHEVQTVVLNQLPGVSPRGCWTGLRGLREP